jgi:hypothetical protein
MSQPKHLLFLYELHYTLPSVTAVKFLILLFIFNNNYNERLITNNPIKWDPKFYIISIFFLYLVYKLIFSERTNIRMDK